MQNLLLTVITLVTSHIHIQEGNNSNSILSIYLPKEVPVNKIIIKHLEKFQTKEVITFYH